MLVDCSFHLTVSKSNVCNRVNAILLLVQTTTTTASISKMLTHKQLQHQNCKVTTMDGLQHQQRQQHHQQQQTFQQPLVDTTNSRLQIYIDTLLQSRGYSTAPVHIGTSSSNNINNVSSKLYQSIPTPYQKACYGQRLINVANTLLTTNNNTNTTSDLQSLYNIGLATNPYSCKTREFFIHTLCSTYNYNAIQVLLRNSNTSNYNNPNRSTNIVQCVDSFHRTPLHRVCQNKVATVTTTTTEQTIATTTVRNPTKESKNNHIYNNKSTISGTTCITTTGIYQGNSTGSPNCNCPIVHRKVQFQIVKVLLQRDPMMINITDCWGIKPFQDIPDDQVSDWIYFLDTIKDEVWPCLVVPVTAIVPPVEVSNNINNNNSTSIISTINYNTCTKTSSAIMSNSCATTIDTNTSDGDSDSDSYSDSYNDSCSDRDADIVSSSCSESYVSELAPPPVSQQKAKRRPFMERIEKIEEEVGEQQEQYIIQHKEQVRVVEEVQQLPLEVAAMVASGRMTIEEIELFLHRAMPIEENSFASNSSILIDANVNKRTISTSAIIINQNYHFESSFRRSDVSASSKQLQQQHHQQHEQQNHVDKKNQYQLYDPTMDTVNNDDSVSSLDEMLEDFAAVIDSISSITVPKIQKHIHLNNVEY